MQLDYKILWIDDEKDSVETQAELLNDFLGAQGFVLKKFWAKDKKTLEDLLSTTIDFDFIFVDNSFNDEDLGLDFIEQLRANKVYADILFYSSIASVAKLKEEAIKKSIQSVYIYTKSAINADHSLFENIIQYRINKEMDASSLRGIAMSEIAVFDQEILNILKNNDMKKNILLKIKEQKSNHCDLCFAPEEKVWEMVDSEKGTIIFNSSSRKDVLHSKLLKGKEQYKKEYCEIRDNYHNELLLIRNKLAHQITDFLSKEEKILFRKNLIKFRDIFNKLKDELCPKP